MSQPVAWPGSYFFYPIGNTSALCLTRDVAVEEPASLLLLGCGDPRNVLYTVFCEAESDRKLDFTCCDYDPAVLARNVLLFSMILDNQDATTLWNIFFHIHIDQRCLSVLTEQCRTLIAVSGSLQNWSASPYGKIMKMSTEYTLTELRRHWALYTEMHSLPSERLKKLESAFTSVSNSVHNVFVAAASRSAGPLFQSAIEVSALQFTNYWEQGTTSMDANVETTSPLLLNPTFFYSLADEGFNVHYGTDPMQPFHLASFLGNTKGPVSVSDLVSAAQTEFKQWCLAFRSRVTSATRPSSALPIMRFFLGEAIAVCRAISLFSETGATTTRIPVSQWKAQTITLNREADGGYGDAPTIFDVIDTSNLCDHVGLLNVLIASIPLLQSSLPSSGVLYTESLLFRGENATKEFAERLYGDITTIGLLIGLCPIDYVSGFSSRSNTHEVLFHDTLKKLQKSSHNIRPGQFQQLITWRKPSFGDPVHGHVADGARVHSFDPWQLGTFLYDMYHKLFEQEDSATWFFMNERNQQAIASSNMIFYSRETFVLFLKLIRQRLRIPSSPWQQIMDRFFEIRDADKSMPMDTYNENDLSAHLHRYGLYTMAYLRPLRKPGLFSKWDSVPMVVRIILSVPRAKLRNVFSGPDVGTPLLQCDIAAHGMQNVFSSLHLAFGKVISVDDARNPRVIIEEDPQGQEGSLPLLVSFIMPSFLLANIPDQEAVNVSFGLRSYPGSLPFVKKLGDMLRIFTAKLLDNEHVHVLPESALVFKMSPSHATPSPSPNPIPSAVRGAGLLNQIGDCEDVMVELDDDCEFVGWLKCKVLVKGDGPLQRIFADRSTPVSATQISPCTMRIVMKGYRQDVVFPFPVIGSWYKVRLARTSMYIEVVVPPYGPLKPDGMKLGLFPTVGVNGNFTPWNIHLLPLDRLPVIDIKVPGTDKWLCTLMGSQMSARERSLKKHERHNEDTLMAVKDTIHSIILCAAGAAMVAGVPQSHPRLVFALRDKASQNCDTIFFISDLRYDLTCHSVVFDGYVLPLSEGLMEKIRVPFGRLVREGNIYNIGTYEGETEAWKQLIPAFVERCRTWTHKPNCEYVSTGKVPLTEEFDEVPICSCGRGKDVDGLMKREMGMWGDFAPYVTRIAISPLFAVSYLEAIVRDPEARRCFVCRGKGKPRIKTCAKCKKVRYCSEVCQKKDWQKHKKVCKA